jgi:hypothetical protein
MQPLGIAHENVMDRETPQSRVEGWLSDIGSEDFLQKSTTTCAVHFYYD